MAAPSLPSAPEAEPATAFDVVALVASAGGLDAVGTVLRGLPPDLPAAVLVMQHLAGGTSALVEILGRRAALPVTWADDGAPLTPGRVVVCPPRRRLEVLPDGTCALHDHARGARDFPLDAFLASLADSFGRRALAVVLTGMGRDGAAGARALKQAGGVVLVQSEDTAEQPAMPRAAVEAGGADLVMPLHEIGHTVVDLVAGGRLPVPHTERDAAERLFAGPGEAAALLRAFDWPRSPLGPVSAWSASLRTAARLALESPVATCLMWGPEYVQIYNDHYRAVMGAKHPAGLAQPNRACWPEVWHLNEPLYARVRGGESIGIKDALYPITRHGALEDAWFDLSFAPVRDEAGAVGGVVGTVFETTSRVLGARRLGTLHALASRATGATSPREALGRALEVLAGNAHDLPFALAYHFDDARAHAHLAGAVGLEEGGPLAPRTLRLEGGHPVWPLAKLVADGAPVALGDLSGRGRGAGADPEPGGPTAALLLPLRLGGDERPAGALALGLGPRLPFDATYREFLDLVAAHVSASLTEARARQKERERHERLAELDRAKTEFFSNVSHEFRTPLTLLLAPLDELARRRAELPAGLAGEVEPAARNARRLLNLVNTLLDFSQIEAGRLHARFEPVDLAALTADVASLFRSAAERAGLGLRVDCPPLPEPVWVDAGMWEKVVSNLLSNALKFTFEGEVAVELRALPQHVELVVRDTGVGIPPDEQPHLFKRFHRVRGAKARTHEGSGIGLALVHELVRQHHGRVRVRSKEGEGSAFTVWLLRGPRPARDEPAVDPPPRAAKAAALALAEEAARWGEDGTGAAASPADGADDPLGPPEAAPLSAPAPSARVLVVDDNADMRAYLTRLLAPHWQVEAAADGEAALAAMRLRPPDLVVADVMMPNLDGFGLLRRIRGDEALKATPVLLATARAGEEAAIEGLLAGADDYVAKPFSARELVARVGAQLGLARARRRAAELNAFLVRFSDAARALSDPSPVALTACRLLTELLGTDRTLWADVDWATREYVATWVHRADGTPGEPSRWPLDPREPFAAEHLAGRSVVYDDVEGDPRIPGPAKAATAARGQRSGIAVPVVVAGTLRAVVNTSQSVPRRWTPEEVASVEALAGRAWAEVERARTEAALRASERRYRLLFENMGEGFALAEMIWGDDGRPVDWRYLEANDAWTQTGVPVAETVGRTAREVNPAIEPSWIETYGRVVRTGQPVAFEAYAAGFGKWLDTVAFKHSENCFGLVFRDVTGRKEAEAAAARAERSAEAILERMGDAHCVLDREFRIVGVNAAAGRVLGVPRAALLGRSHWEVFPASVDAPVGRALRRVVAEGVEQHLTHHYTGEGYDLHLELDAYPTDEGGLAMFWRDVTERVRAEGALRASEEKYRALFTEMDEAYAVVEVMADAAGRWNDFLFLEVNPAFLRHTGMPYPVGRTATELLGTPNPRWAELYGRAVETGESIRLEEAELTLGRTFDLNIFRLGGPGSRRVAVLFTDITARKRAEASPRPPPRRRRKARSRRG